MTQLAFLGTGDFRAPGRYWNSFVLDGAVLVEPAPTALPNLRRAGFRAGAIDAVVISHFHADHTFGWPFLLLEFIRSRRSTPLHIVGPPGVEAYLAGLMRAGSVSELDDVARERLDIRYVEVDGTWQQAGLLRFRAVEVDHVPYLRCFGFVFDRDGRHIGYSGDTRPCEGLEVLAGQCDALVLECNGPHPPPASHMDVSDVAALRSRHPDLRLVLTHLGAAVDPSALTGMTVPEDYAVIEV